MKNIYFNAMILNNKPTGLGVYCKNILSRLSKLDIDYVVYNSTLDISKIIKDSNINQIKINCNSKNKLVSVLLRNYKFNSLVNKKSKAEKITVYSPTQHGVKGKNINQIITIHDLLPLIYPSGRYHQYFYYKYILPKIIKKAEKIITISENTKNDIIKYYGTDSEKVIVIYNGYDKPKLIDKEYSVKYIENKYKVKDYLLMIGIHYRYKNLHNVIIAYSKIRTDINKKLVIVGNYNTKYGFELKKLVNELNLNKYVIFTGYIDEEDKNFMYQAANLFIYPSLYEGFGLPILEAMANGTPVICSNTSSLPEVAGNAALLFNPNSIDDIERCILLLTDEKDASTEALIRKGYENIKRFSWENTVLKIKEVLKN